MSKTQPFNVKEQAVESERITQFKSNGNTSGMLPIADT